MAKEKAAGQHNGAVETGYKTGQAGSPNGAIEPTRNLLVKMSAVLLPERRTEIICTAPPTRFR
jgi:hypothetical protein